MDNAFLLILCQYIIVGNFSQLKVNSSHISYLAKDEFNGRIPQSLRFVVSLQDKFISELSNLFCCISETNVKVSNDSSHRLSFS